MPTPRENQQVLINTLSGQLHTMPPEHTRLHAVQQEAQTARGTFAQQHPEAGHPMTRKWLHVGVQALVCAIVYAIDVLLLRLTLEDLLTDVFDLETAQRLTFLVPLAVMGLDASYGFLLGKARHQHEQDTQGLTGIGPLPAGIAPQSAHRLWEWGARSLLLALPLATVTSYVRLRGFSMESAPFLIFVIILGAAAHAAVIYGVAGLVPDLYRIADHWGYKRVTRQLQQATLTTNTYHAQVVAVVQPMLTIQGNTANDPLGPVQMVAPSEPVRQMILCAFGRDIFGGAPPPNPDGPDDPDGLSAAASQEPEPTVDAANAGRVYHDGMATDAEVEDLRRRAQEAEAAAAAYARRAEGQI